ncbi:hypothetical protein ACFFMP_08355 [Pseudoroseomonas cervicalis]|uniref:Response regulatory domain-containing protein n=1 Tax=Pseudoroseomonas cervicalis ATCC 49957 TaxID=525371 RepID=D5RTD5_9PROT|nr:hypothetical protein [Pseudoroseomonas cervicalis]EFH09427.1 hypothetical protein HMPREF0731_4347 [Pseudoroseomonas cervicalis ATCC 49957]
MSVIHAALFRRRILLAEDCFFLASYAADVLEEAGALVVGPVATLDEAIEIAGSMHIDAAVYNSFLWYRRADALAQVLDQREVPSIVLSLFSDPGNDPLLQNHLMLQWPFAPSSLIGMLSAILLQKKEPCRRRLHHPHPHG